MTHDDPVAFRLEIDRLLIAGEAPTSIADRFGIRSRGIRRRRRALIAEGRQITQNPGTMPEDNHAITDR